MQKLRLDKLLLEKGLVDSITKAQGFILAGRIRVDNTPVTKPGEMTKPTSEITILKTNPYVSRGGLKLEGAIEKFNLKLEGKICMDIGASTGGFTDCLLKHGAREVYAIDVGKGLLDYGLRHNPKVKNMEGINFRYFSNQNLKRQIEFVTIDVSFISLDKILPVAADYLVNEGKILCLIKPQFEATQKEARKGVVRDEFVRKKIVDKIRNLAEVIGFVSRGEMESPLKGPKGNVEYFLLLEHA